MREALIVVANGGLTSKSYRYIVGYKGFVFHAKANRDLVLPGKSEIVHAGNIWIRD